LSGGQIHQVRLLSVATGINDKKSIAVHFSELIKEKQKLNWL
jgi:hypothetical protein